MGDQGYLQRIAVHPAVRRMGIGQTLVADAMHWLWREGVTRSYVNTQLDNAPGSRSYESSASRCFRPGWRYWDARCEPEVGAHDSGRLIALVVGPVAWVPRVGAQTDPNTPTLTLTSQDPWTPTGGAFTMGLKTGGNTDGLQLTLTVHDRVSSRSAFDATLGTSPTFPQTLTLQHIPLDDLPPDATGLRVVQLGLARLGIRRAGNGVYPMEVQLRDANETPLAGFVTHVVVVDLSAAAPKQLDVAWVWPLVAAPAFPLDGPPDADVVTQLVPTGRLGRQALAIGADTDVPLTLAPSPETLDAWLTLAQNQDNTELGSGVDALRRAVTVTHHQVLAGSFVPLDLPSIFDGGLGGTLSDELDHGADTLQTFFNTHLDPSTAMPGDLDTTSLDALRTAARTRLVLDGSALAPYDGRFTAARPRAPRRAAGDASDQVTVLATDPGLESFLRGDAAPALRAAHLLATLAVIQGEQPSLAHAVTFANPTDWDPSDDFVTALLAGLRANPFVRPVTVDTLLAETPQATVDDSADNEPVIRTLAAVEVKKPPVTPRSYYQGLLDRRRDRRALQQQRPPRRPRRPHSPLGALVRPREPAWSSLRSRATPRHRSVGTRLPVADPLARTIDHHPHVQ